MAKDDTKAPRVNLTGLEHVKGLGAVVALAVATSGTVTVSTSSAVTAAIDTRLETLEQADARRDADMRNLAAAVDKLATQVERRAHDDDEYKQRLERTLGRIEAALPALELRAAPRRP